MKRNLTNWFDGSLHSPSRVGWYNVVLKDYFHFLDEEEKSYRRRYWDGEMWSAMVLEYDSNDEAVRCMRVQCAYPEEVIWRGCTEEQFE